MPNHSASGLRRLCRNGRLRRGFLPQRHDDGIYHEGTKSRRVFNERCWNYSDNLFVERIADADWSTPPVGTSPIVNNLYQGMSYDAVTGLYNERARWYSPSLGTWISQDPMQYINGADTYQFVMGNPVGATDPSGLMHGNSISDTRSQIVYEITDSNGNIYKYGISGTSANAAGDYPRLQSQLNQLNKGLPPGQQYSGRVIGQSPDRASAVQAEQDLVDNYFADNSKLPGIMKRPFPSDDAIAAYNDKQAAKAAVGGKCKEGGDKKDGAADGDVDPEESLLEDLAPELLDGIDPLGIVLNDLTDPAVAGGAGDVLPPPSFPMNIPTRTMWPMSQPFMQSSAPPSFFPSGPVGPNTAYLFQVPKGLP